MSPWSVKRRRRRNFARAAVVVAMAAALVGVVSSAQATPEEPGRRGDRQRARELRGPARVPASDALGEYQELAESLPLTDLAPGDLRGAQPQQAAWTTAAGALGTVRQHGRSSRGDSKRVDGTTDGVASTSSSAPARSRRPAVTVDGDLDHDPDPRRARTVNQPLDFSVRPGRHRGRQPRRSTSSSTRRSPSTSTRARPERHRSRDRRLARSSDDRSLRPRHRLGRQLHRALRLHRHQGLDGRPEHAATETATLHACANVNFQDPDSTGGITRDEWTSHALTELATANTRRRRGRSGQRPRRRPSTSTRR